MSPQSPQDKIQGYHTSSTPQLLFQLIHEAEACAHETAKGQVC